MTENEPPGDSQPDEVKKWKDLANGFEKGQLDEATAQFLEDLLNAEVSPCLEASSRAADLVERHHWDGAIAAYHEALRLAKDPPDRVTVLKDFPALLALVGQEREAIKYSRLAVAEAGKIDFNMVSITLLWALARRLVDYDRYTDAKDAIEEAFAIFDDSIPGNTLGAQCRTVRARIALHFGDLAAADRDLSESGNDLFKKEPPDCAIGIHLTVARWWEAKAQLYHARDDTPAAVTAWENAITSHRNVLKCPQCETPYAEHRLANVLKHYAEALKTAGQVEESDRATAERDQLIKSLNLPES